MIRLTFWLWIRRPEKLWYHERETDTIHESPDAYTTPALSKTKDGIQLVILGGDYVTGHDPDTGREIWRAGDLNPQKSLNYRYDRADMGHCGWYNRRCQILVDSL